MNKAEKLSTLSEKLGVEFPQELTVAQIDAVLDTVSQKEALEAVNTELSTAVAELNEALKAAESKPTIVSDKPIVKIGKDQYKVLGAVKHNGAIHSPAEIAADKDLAAKLVEIGSGLLQKI